MILLHQISLSSRGGLWKDYGYPTMALHGGLAPGVMEEDQHEALADTTNDRGYLSLD